MIGVIFLIGCSAPKLPCQHIPRDWGNLNKWAWPLYSFHDGVVIYVIDVWKCKCGEEMKRMYFREIIKENTSQMSAKARRGR